MSASHTCITCQVIFKNSELQRDHYKSDWHRYNLKRKVVEIPPVTLEEFETRVQEHRQSEQAEASVDSQLCKFCRKLFNSKKAFDNHLNSKKHKQAEKDYVEPKVEEISHNSDSSYEKIDPASALPEPTKFVVLNPNESADEEVETDSEIEELDSDEWDECHIKGSDSLIKPQDCLFCCHHSRTIVKNLNHMSEAHSFFIPDPEFCVDVKGLLLYLGEKISQGFMCLWCNETGRTFYSMEAAQGHMVAKGHCKMLHEGLALAEYADFYDYSSSYPEQADEADEMDVDAEVAPPETLGDGDFQLVLPSGAVVGHRSLMRYYKQHLSDASGGGAGGAGGAVPARRSDRKLHRLLGHYRALGWAPRDQHVAARKARDIHFMKRVQAKWQMKLSLKANKFQKHYRAQVLF